MDVSKVFCMCTHTRPRFNVSIRKTDDQGDCGQVILPIKGLFGDLYESVLC